MFVDIKNYYEVTRVPFEYDGSANTDFQAGRFVTKNATGNTVAVTNANFTNTDHHIKMVFKGSEEASERAAKVLDVIEPPAIVETDNFDSTQTYHYGDELTLDANGRITLRTAPATQGLLGYVESVGTSTITFKFVDY